MKLFADDDKVYRSISEVEHVYQVQTSMDEAVTWTNIGKCCLTLRNANF